MGIEELKSTSEKKPKLRLEKLKNLVLTLAMLFSTGTGSIVVASGGGNLNPKQSSDNTLLDPTQTPTPQPEKDPLVTFEELDGKVKVTVANKCTIFFNSGDIKPYYLTSEGQLPYEIVVLGIDDTNPDISPLVTQIFNQFFEGSSIFQNFLEQYRKAGIPIIIVPDTTENDAISGGRNFAGEFPAGGDCFITEKNGNNLIRARFIVIKKETWETLLKLGNILQLGDTVDMEKLSAVLSLEEELSHLMQNALNLQKIEKAYTHDDVKDLKEFFQQSLDLLIQYYLSGKTTAYSSTNSAQLQATNIKLSDLSGNYNFYAGTGQYAAGTLLGEAVLNFYLSNKENYTDFSAFLKIYIDLFKTFVEKFNNGDFEEEIGSRSIFDLFLFFLNQEFNTTDLLFNYIRFLFEEYEMLVKGSFSELFINSIRNRQPDIDISDWNFSSLRVFLRINPRSPISPLVIKNSSEQNQFLRIKSLFKNGELYIDKAYIIRATGDAQEIEINNDELNVWLEYSDRLIIFIKEPRTDRADSENNIIRAFSISKGGDNVEQPSNEMEKFLTDETTLQQVIVSDLEKVLHNEVPKLITENTNFDELKKYLQKHAKEGLFLSVILPIKDNLPSIYPSVRFGELIIYLIPSADYRNQVAEANEHFEGIWKTCITFGDYLRTLEITEQTPTPTPVPIATEIPKLSPEKVKELLEEAYKEISDPSNFIHLMLNNYNIENFKKLLNAIPGMQIINVSLYQRPPVYMVRQGLITINPDGKNIYLTVTEEPDPNYPVGLTIILSQDLFTSSNENMETFVDSNGDIIGVATLTKENTNEILGVLEALSKQDDKILQMLLNGFKEEDIQTLLNAFPGSSIVSDKENVNAIFLQLKIGGLEMHFYPRK